jgi:hypothetical protein
MSEPFGYFKAEPFGWVDCAETDDGAVALYDTTALQAAIDAAYERAAVALEAGVIGHSECAEDVRALKKGTS